jgi:hypothetical protein
LQLKEILNRIDIPAFADIPDREAMARQPSKRWRLPNTEIDIVSSRMGSVPANIWCPPQRSIASGKK